MQNVVYQSTAALRDNTGAAVGPVRHRLQRHPPQADRVHAEHTAHDGAHARRLVARLPRHHWRPAAGPHRDAHTLLVPVLAAHRHRLPHHDTRLAHEPAHQGGRALRRPGAGPQHIAHRCRPPLEHQRLHVPEQRAPQQRVQNVATKRTTNNINRSDNHEQRDVHRVRVDGAVRPTGRVVRGLAAGGAQERLSDALLHHIVARLGARHPLALEGARVECAFSAHRAGARGDEYGVARARQARQSSQLSHASFARHCREAVGRDERARARRRHARLQLEELDAHQARQQ